MAASVMSHDHEVELVSHKGLNLDDLGRRFNIDLSNVSLRVVPAMPPMKFQKFTSRYDLFINSSFMTGQPSGAKHSLLLVLFPSPIESGLWARLRRLLGALIIRCLLVPDFHDGFYDVQELGHGWFRYSSDQSVLRLRNPLIGNDINIEIVLGNFRPVGLGSVNIQASVHGEEVARTTIDSNDGEYISWRLDVPARLSTGPELDVEIRCDTYNPADMGSDDNREIGVAVTDAFIVHWRHRLYQMVFRRMAMSLGLRLEGVRSYGSLEFLDSYDLISPISEFSLGWMQHYWERDGPILYPPVSTQNYFCGDKQNIILSVGRFFGAGGHSKRHDVLINAFRSMIDDGLEGWELHLAGGKGSRAVDVRYFGELERMADGLPVVLHPDISFEALRNLYSQATIYWHASGYGSNVNKNPVMFEHFGITTVEAMASGCIPVVIGKGGQPELVTDGTNGFLWKNAKELKHRTLQIIGDQKLSGRLRTAAIQSSKRFSESTFRERLLDLVFRMRESQ
tara:strand:- start:450 stop:1976 length:1527 start_codon:yes stop_codon:yes gene_type:complete